MLVGVNSLSFVQPSNTSQPKSMQVAGQTKDKCNENIKVRTPTNLYHRLTRFTISDLRELYSFSYGRGFLLQKKMYVATHSHLC